MTSARGRWLLTVVLALLPGSVLSAAEAASGVTSVDQETPTAAAEPTVPSRAERLVAAREARLGGGSPPSRGLLERFFYNSEQRLLMQKFAAGYRGFSFTTGGLPSGRGLQFGVGYFRPGIGYAYPRWDSPDRVDFDVFATYSVRRYRQIQTNVAWHNIGGSRFGLGARGELYAWPRRDFYGRGPDSRLEDETTYSTSGNVLGGEAWWAPSPRLRVGGGLFRLATEGAPGTDPEEPSSEELFGSEALPGFGARTTFRRADVFLEVDRRDNPLFPRAGSLLHVKVSDYEDLDRDALSFRRTYVHAQQYVPFLDKTRVFALRGMLILSDPDDDADVPIYYWPALGSSRRFRGVETNRFQDRNLVLLTGEYRWEIWWSMDAALFVDLGNVTLRAGDLLDDLKTTYGFGLRLHSLDKFLLRTDFAFSDEGLRVHATIRYPFGLGGLPH